MGHNLITKPFGHSMAQHGGQLQQQQPEPLFQSPQQQQQPSFQSPAGRSQERGRAVALSEADRARQSKTLDSQFVYSDSQVSHWRQDPQHGGRQGLTSNRERGGPSEFSPGAFRNSPRGRDSSSFHARSRDSPAAQQRDRRSGSGNRSRSPPGSNPSASSNSTHRPAGFEQRRGRVEMHPRNRETPTNSSPSFDPSTNDQPLDFQRPTAVLSTEQAVQQDMARTMQAMWYRDKDGPAPLLSFGGRQLQQQQQPRAEELVLPLQFGKNAAKKTPQAIMEEKLRKEREERQKKEMELRKKKEDEERQKWEKEREERHRRQEEERQKEEKELETRRRNFGEFFTPGKERPRVGPQFNNRNQEENEHLDNPPRPGRSAGNDFLRTNQTPQNPYGYSGVRFQGETDSPGSFPKEGYSHAAHLPAEKAKWTDDASNIWDRADKGENTLQRSAPLHMPNRGGFQRGSHVTNNPARGNLHQSGIPFGPGRRNFKEVPHIHESMNIWDTHDHTERDALDKPADVIHARTEPGPRSAPEPRFGPAPGPRFGPATAPGPRFGPAPAPAPGPRFGPAPAPAPGPRPATAPGPRSGPAPGPRSAPAPGPRFAPAPRFGPAPGPRYGPVPSDVRPEAGTDRFKQTNIWDAHDHAEREAPDKPAERILARTGPRGQWPKESTDRFEPTNIWDAQDQVNDGKERSNVPDRMTHGRGGPAMRRPFGARILTNRGGHGRVMDDWEHIEHEPQVAPTNLPVGSFRGRGSDRAQQGVLVRGAMRGKGITRGNFAFHAEDPQKQANHDFVDDNAFNAPVSKNSASVVYPNSFQRPSSHQGNLGSKNELGFQDKNSVGNQPQRGGYQGAGGGYQSKNHWENSNVGSYLPRGGLPTGHPQGQPLAGRWRGRHQFAETEHVEAQWQDTYEDRGSQFEPVSCDEGSEFSGEPAPWEQNKGWNMGARVARGRGGNSRPGRGFAARGREFTSHGRGFGSAKPLEDSSSSESGDALYSEGVSELQEANQHFRTPMSREALNVQRGRGLRSRVAPFGRGAENRAGRGMPMSRGTENPRGRVGGRGINRQHSEPLFESFSESDTEQPWEGEYQKPQQQGRGGRLLRDSPNISPDWSTGRGVPSYRGNASLGGRGATREAARDSGAQFRGRGRGLLPTPM
ncbi:hypothetical protein ElyMa_001413000 [Elysia marginata]|uniref:BAT2 N-terminal domain-containing protein n=1 Tax=Elysia marginata TaxID=1093978 RepID=A0AAV4IUG6_9GAST|nr:hypothetical protein ElyMa_001413000 [Elysia marginata]